jgi:hypothetical protein
MSRHDLRVKNFPIRDLRAQDARVATHIAALGRARCLSLHAMSEAHAPYTARVVDRYCARFGISGVPMATLPHAASALVLTGGVAGVGSTVSSALRERLASAFTRTRWFEPSSETKFLGQLSGHASRDVSSSQVQVEAPRLPFDGELRYFTVEERTAKYSFGTSVDMECPTGPRKVDFANDTYNERARAKGATFDREPPLTSLELAFAKQLEDVVVHFVNEMNNQYGEAFCNALHFTTEEAARCALGESFPLAEAVSSALSSMFGRDTAALFGR